MANYNVQITNGSGSANMQIGTYSVTASANGYEATTLSPVSYSATSGGVGNFTLSATGVLTIIFNETGAAGGTPVTSGSVVMTDATGETQYGSPVSINGNGEAVFNGVPFNSGTPYQLYFKQLSTDGNHQIYQGVLSVAMASATQTEYALNQLVSAAQTFSLSDATYGFPVADATLNFTGE